METRRTQTANRQPTGFDPFRAERENAELTRQRLDVLLKINAETEHESEIFADDRERLEAELMTNPISSEKAFSYFGVMLGTFPPAAVFTQIILDSRSLRGDEAWMLGVFAIVNIVSAIVGYFSGKLISRIVKNLEKISWTWMILALPFVGILWGILSGGAGGAVIFIVGAFVGALLGAAVGSVALPAFTIFHRLLKRGDQIETKHFLPLAFGITFIISAFIIGI